MTLKDLLRQKLATTLASLCRSPHIQLLVGEGTELTAACKKAIVRVAIIRQQLVDFFGRSPALTSDRGRCSPSTAEADCMSANIRAAWAVIAEIEADYTLFNNDQVRTELERRLEYVESFNWPASRAMWNALDRATSVTA